MSLKFSAKHWGQLSSELKDSAIDTDKRLGDQIQQLLAPSDAVEEHFHSKAKAPSLVRHTEVDGTFH